MTRQGRMGPPRGSGNLGPRCFAGSWNDFFAILVTFFFSSLFRCLLGSIFARFSTPTCLPKSTKIAQKSMPRCLPMLTSFFDRFLIDFYSQLRPPEPTKSLKSLQFYNIFLFSSHFKIRSILGTLRVPSWLHFPPQLASKNPPKSTKNRCQDAFPS